MIAPRHNGHSSGHPGVHPDERGFFGGPRSEACLALAITVGLAVIAVAAAVIAAGARLEPVAYLFLVLSAAALALTYAITFVRNEFRAALTMVAFWGITLVSLYVLFYAFG